MKIGFDNNPAEAPLALETGARNRDTAGLNIVSPVTDKPASCAETASQRR
jgi:hypothetical protein